MIWGVFSDIHSNYEALKAVFEFYRGRGIKNFVCCGDIVGYGPRPRECLEFVSSLENAICVMGNHDAVLAGKMERRWFKQEAIKAIELNRAEMSEENMRYLESLPDFFEGDFTAVHGSPRSRFKEYMLTAEQFTANLEYWKKSPCFFGHTHIPDIVSYSLKGKYITAYGSGENSRVKLENGNLYMLNPGSVGQPRDSNPRASCAVYDDEDGIFEIFRIEYDIEKTRADLLGKGYPKMFADRLKFGM